MSQLRLSPLDVRADTYRGAVGCPSCNDTGYKGRSGVFEVLPIDGTVREHISNAAPEAALRTAARMIGMRSLREDSLEKAARGKTTLEEVVRTTTTEVHNAGDCPACGASVDDDYVLCPWCAADLHPDACSGCLRDLERGWKVCPSCGTPADSPAGGASVAATQPATDENAAAASAAALFGA